MQTKMLANFIRKINIIGLYRSRKLKKTQAIISKRIKNIIESGYFGRFLKNVSEYDKDITKNCIFELRWDDASVFILAN